MSAVLTGPQAVTGPAPELRGGRSPRVPAARPVDGLPADAPPTNTIKESNGVVMADNRTLTDDDVAAIAEQVKHLIMEDLQIETGKTVWMWAKRIVIGVMLYVVLVGSGLDKHVPATALAQH